MTCCLHQPKGSRILYVQVVLVVKNPPANAGDTRDADLIPRSGGSLGGGHGNALQYSYLENPLDRGAWRATVHGLQKSQTRLSTNATDTTDVQVRGHFRAPNEVGVAGGSLLPPLPSPA